MIYAMLVLSTLLVISIAVNFLLYAGYARLLEIFLSEFLVNRAQKLKLDFFLNSYKKVASDLDNPISAIKQLWAYFKKNEYTFTDKSKKRKIVITFLRVSLSKSGKYDCDYSSTMHQLSWLFQRPDTTLAYFLPKCANIMHEIEEFYKNMVKTSTPLQAPIIRENFILPNDKSEWERYLSAPDILTNSFYKKITPDIDGS